MFRAFLASALLVGCATPFSPMAVRITHATAGQVDRVCYGFMKRQAEITGRRIETVARDYGACAIVSERYGVCLVLLPHRGLVGGVEYARLLAHELPHCNGWRHG